MNGRLKAIKLLPFTHIVSPVVLSQQNRFWQAVTQQCEVVQLPRLQRCCIQKTGFCRAQSLADEEPKRPNVKLKMSQLNIFSVANDVRVG